MQAATNAPPLQLDKLPTADPAVNLKEFMKHVEENAGKRTLVFHACYKPFLVVFSAVDGEYTETSIDEVLQSETDNAAK